MAEQTTNEEQASTAPNDEALTTVHLARISKLLKSTPALTATIMSLRLTLSWVQQGAPQ
jgi:hypothetical protein